MPELRVEAQIVLSPLPDLICISKEFRCVNNIFVCPKVCFTKKNSITRIGKDERN